jgi:endonuclease-3 related protein
MKKLYNYIQIYKSKVNFLKIYNSYELLIKLRDLNLLQNKPKYWWSDSGNFKVVIGVILTQNTKWENVEKSLINLKGFLDLESFLKLDINSIKTAIKPSGFYNQKATRLYQLAKNIK